MAELQLIPKEFLQLWKHKSNYKAPQAMEWLPSEKTAATDDINLYKSIAYANFFQWANEDDHSESVKIICGKAVAR